MATVNIIIVIVLLALVGCEGREQAVPPARELLTPEEREEVTKKIKEFFDPISTLSEADEYKEKGMFAKAEQLYQSVIDTRSSEPFFTTRAYVGLAEVYVEMGRAREARAAAEKAVQGGKLVSGEYWTLGECYEKLGDPTKAEEVFLKAIELQPEAWLYTLLGQFYGKHGQDSKAEAAFKRGLELDPANCSSHLLVSTYYRRAKRHPEAIAAYQSAIKYCDSNERKVEILNNMGAVYRTMQKPDKSAEAYEHALSLATNPDNVGMVCRNMASLSLWFTASEDVDEALRLCDVALKNDPQNAAALRSKAYALSRTERYEDAHKLLDQSLKIRPREPEAFLIRAHVYLNQGQNNKALEAAKRSVELSRGKYLWSDATLGEVYVRTGEYEKAVELLEPLVEQGSDFADVLYWYGQALANSGQQEIGREFVERAVSKLPIVVEYKQGLQALQKQ